MMRGLIMMWIAVVSWLGGCQAGGPAVETDDMPQRVSLDVAQWRGDIDRFLAADASDPPPRQGILFYGSSTIRMWDVERYFPGRPAINRGFGGSTTPAVIRYMHLVCLPYEPSVIVFFCGTNDIAQGQPWEAVVEDFTFFAGIVHTFLPTTHIIYLQITPTPSRWSMWPENKQVNDVIAAYAAERAWITYVDTNALVLDANGEPRPELFRDGLHLTEDGYAQVSVLIEQELEALEHAHPTIAPVEPAEDEPTDE